MKSSESFLKKLWRQLFRPRFRTHRYNLFSDIEHIGNQNHQIFERLKEVCSDVCKHFRKRGDRKGRLQRLVGGVGGVIVYFLLSLLPDRSIIMGDICRAAGRGIPLL